MCEDFKAVASSCSPSPGFSETCFYDPETGNVLDHKKENVIGSGYIDPEDGHLYMTIRGHQAIRPNYIDK